MSGVTLRPAAPADYDTIAEIWHASASLPGVGPLDMPMLAELKLRVPEEVQHGWVVTVAVDSCAMLGFLATKPAERVLAELFLRPEARGRGIGEQLLAAARTQMPGGFTLFTRVSNGPACRFYERQGLAKLHDAVHPRFGDAIVYFGWSP